MKRLKLILILCGLLVTFIGVFQYASNGYIFHKEVDQISFTDIEPSDDVTIEFSYGHWGSVTSRFDVKNGNFYEGGGFRLTLDQYLTGAHLDQGAIRYIRREVPNTKGNHDEIWSIIEALLKPEDHRELFLGWRSSVKVIHKRPFRVPKVMEYISPNTSLVSSLQCVGFDNRDLCDSAYINSNEQLDSSTIIEDEF